MARDRVWLVLIASRAAPSAPILRGVQRIPVLRVESKGTLSPIWRENEADLQLLGTLGIQSIDNLPCLSLFAVDETEVVAFERMALVGQSTEQAYETLRAAVQLVTEALEQIHPDNLKNAAGVCAALSMRLQSDRDWKQLRSVGPFFKWVAGKLGLI
jgi:hypothetical protein